MTEAARAKAEAEVLVGMKRQHLYDRQTEMAAIPATLTRTMPPPEGSPHPRGWERWNDATDAMLTARRQAAEDEVRTAAVELELAQAALAALDELEAQTEA